MRNASSFTKIKPSKLAGVEEYEDYCVTLTAAGSWNLYRDCYAATNTILACNLCQFRATPSFTLKAGINIRAVNVPSRISQCPKNATFIRTFSLLKVPCYD